MGETLLSRLNAQASNWDEPAFPDRQHKSMQGAALGEVEAEWEPERVLLPRIAIILIALLALAWMAATIIGLVPSRFDAELVRIAGIATNVAPPLALLVGAFLLLRSGLFRRDEPGISRRLAQDVESFAAQAASASAKLSEAHEQLQQQSQAYTQLAERAAGAMLGAIDTMGSESERIERGIDGSVRTLASLTAQLTALGDTAPRIEDRLATLAETLASSGHDLTERSSGLEEQLQATALVAEEARKQLIDASRSLTSQLSGLKEGAQSAGEELAGMSELASARIDLTLDRVQTVLEVTEKRIEAQNKGLADLVETTQAAVESVSGRSLQQFHEHGEEIAARLESLDGSLARQVQKSAIWLDEVKGGIADLTDQFDALEQSALGRSDRLTSTMMALSGETHRLSEALDAGNASSDQLIKRAESLLLALDSSIRELDESMPGAIGRVETRIESMRQSILSAAPKIEAVEVVAAGVVSRMQESDGLATAQVATLADSLQRSQAAIASQKKQIAGLAGAVTEASDSMARLGESVGPQMVEALVRVRETAEAAAARARDAIAGAIPQAAARLGEASSVAVEQAVSNTVAMQLEQLSVVADNAVKAAHRATDKLTRQMLTLTDSSAELEKRLAANAKVVETRDREMLSHRSAALIKALNSRAIDVTKWLDQEITEADWQGYLNGDQGFFARRAVRLLSGGDARDVHALYEEDADFQEHVNRYIHDFEDLLKGVLAAQEGSALAVTMLSSDLGKLYVALAQGIERLRTR